MAKRLTGKDTSTTGKLFAVDQITVAVLMFEMHIFIKTQNLAILLVGVNKITNSLQTITDHIWNICNSSETQHCFF